MSSAPDSSKKIRARVVVSGLVQGVYFRQNTKDIASEHFVRGWVRNLRDGRVEALLEGDETSVRRVIEWCHKGPPKGRVESVDAEYQTYSGEFKDFTISY